MQADDFRRPTWYLASLLSLPSPGKVSQCLVGNNVEGEGIGALRTPTSADGSTIPERLEALNGDARQLSDALLTDTPFRDCLPGRTGIVVHFPARRDPGERRC
jgi:hypothetical protein